MMQKPNVMVKSNNPNILFKPFDSVLNDVETKLMRREAIDLTQAM